MLHLVLAAALIAQAEPHPQEVDKAATELLQKVEDQVMKAKTLHVEFEAAPAAAGRTEKLKGELKIGENGALLMTVKVTERQGRIEEMSLRSDGKTLSVSSSRESVRTDVSKWSPATVHRVLKRTAWVANLLGLFLTFGRGPDPETIFDQYAAKDAKIEGKEKVGDVEATIVTFGVDLKEGTMVNRVSIKAWIDPVKFRVLKREMLLGPEGIVETVSKFELNPAFPADCFEFQNAGMLLEARSFQIAASVLLHARYTGRLPKTLEDLARRPADLTAGALWPEGGFWIGGAIPKDIPYSSDATHFTVGTLKEAIPAFSPVGAPNDRVKNFFEARVRIQLLKAAADSFKRASTLLPKDPQDLVKKPDVVRFWPDGGWAGAKLPLDPWGEPFAFRTGGAFTVRVAKPKGRVLKLADLTAEERNALDRVARPPLQEKDAAEVEKLIRQLGAEKLADREEATKGILAKGGGALHVVQTALDREKDPEVASRLSLIRDQFRAEKTTWEVEMKGGVRSAAGADIEVGGLTANERNASFSLKTITTAQADFRSNDRDGNREMDFWVKDVAGLYGIESAPPAGGEAAPGKAGSTALIKLIEPKLAAADTTEGRWDYPALAIKEPEPKSGYFVAALKNCELGGKVEPYHKGGGRNADMFGFVAYPAEYGDSGRWTFIVNEDNTIWMKDLDGEEVDTFPADPAGAGWRKLD